MGAGILEIAQMIPCRVFDTISTSHLGAQSTSTAARGGGGGGMALGRHLFPLGGQHMPPACTYPSGVVILRGRLKIWLR